MKALILAAGMGSRISDFTRGEPKCLIKINDKTILEQQIHFLNLSGIKNKDIIIITGHKADSIMQKIGNDVTYIHNETYKNTNSLYSMWLARNENYSNGMLLFNADVIFHKQILFNLVRHKGNCIAVDTNKKLTIPKF